MISIKNLSVAYGKKTVIESLNLVLQENEIHGIVGLNGAGKTSLFNVLFGLRKPQEGEILYRNQTITKKDIGYLPTEIYFFHSITGEEYLSLFENNSFDTEKWNELFKLPLKQIIDEYSTGMKKKLALLGVIKQNKPIVLLDEPFNGLDIEMSRILHLILLRLKETGKTIIISSHIIETLTNLCDHIYYLESGKIKNYCSRSEFPDFERQLFELIEKDNSKQIEDLLRGIN